MSSVDAVHPTYTKFVKRWERSRDASEEEWVVKQKGFKYLKPTSGMINNGISHADDLGTQMYEAYLDRAVFPSLVRPAINALIGVMHKKPPKIQLPKQLESLENSATTKGEGLKTLLRCINEQQLMVGRLGLLVELPETRNPIPSICMYFAESIRNWDLTRREDGKDAIDLIVLDETQSERVDEFNWETIKKRLVLDLVLPSETGLAPEAPRGLLPMNAQYRARLVTDSTNDNIARDGQNRQVEVLRDEGMSTDPVFPNFRGKPFNKIPFVFIGSNDLNEDPDQIPMEGLANIAFAIYRGEADYRQSLFMQGQDTLVVVGESADNEGKKRATGVGAEINLEIGGSADYIGVSSSGLSEQKDALGNDYSRAIDMGANLSSSAKGGGREAAESLHIRVAARTATLLTIAKAGAEGLERALKLAAEWIGANPEEVVVTPNTDFVDDKFAPKEVVELMTSKNMGAPIALSDVHAYLKAREFTDKEFDETLDEIEQEEPIIEKPSAPNPFAPVENPEDGNNPTENFDIQT